MLWPVLTFGSLLFYIVALVPALVLAFFTSRDNYAKSTGAVVVTLVVLTLFSDFNVFALIGANPWTALGLIPGYIVAGALYSIFYWWFVYCPKAADVYGTLRAKWMESKGIKDGTPLTPAQRDDVLDYAARYNYNRRFDQFPPQASKNKRRITGWIVYWPFCIIGAFFGDFIGRLANIAWVWLAGTFQRISNHAFSSRFDEFKS